MYYCEVVLGVYFWKNIKFLVEYVLEICCDIIFFLKPCDFLEFLQHLQQKLRINIEIKLIFKDIKIEDINNIRISVQVVEDEL